MDRLFSMIDEAICQLFPDDLSSSLARHLYDLIANGLLGGVRLGRAISRRTAASGAFSTPLAEQVLNIVVERMGDESHLPAGEDEKPGKKRKRKGNDGTPSNAMVAVIGLRSRLVLLVAGHMVSSTSSNTSETISRLINNITAKRNSDPPPEGADTSKRKKQMKQYRWSREILLAAALRLARMLDSTNDSHLSEDEAITPASVLSERTDIKEDETMVEIVSPPAVKTS